MEKLTYFGAPGLPDITTADGFAARIKLVLCEYNNDKFAFKFSPSSLEGKSRKRELVMLRQAFCFVFTKSIFFTSLKAVGSYIGDRDHTTVIHSNQTFIDLVDSGDAAATDLYNYLKNKGLLLYDTNSKRKASG